MTLAAAIIVRDGEETLERCINSVRPYVAEVNVWENNSTDGTLSLLERLAAEPGSPIRVESGAWRDDFAYAREQSFRMASADVDWLVWLDSDDEVVGGQALDLVMQHAIETRVPYAFVTYEYALHDGSRFSQPASRVVLRNGGHWEGIVHEYFRADERFRQVIEQRGSCPPREVIYVRHQHDRSRAPGYYIDLTARATGDMERTPRALYYLGREMLGLGHFPEAQETLTRYLDEGWDAIEGTVNYMRLQALEWLVQAATLNSDGDVAATRGAEHDAYSALMRQREHEVNARPQPAVSRNALCPCGSRKKFKRCHGRTAALTPA